MTEGERWTREALAELRANRSVPAFLRASHRRALDTHRARPELARQARIWMVAGAVAWTLPPLRAHARGGLAWWAVVAAMLDWHLGMVETEDGKPRMLGAADAATLLRAWLVPLAAADPHPLVLATGLATDAADGALARRSEPTRAGRDLEGLVDAAFAAAAVRGLVRAGRLGRAPAALEAARLATGMTAACLAYFGAGRPLPAAVSRAGRSSAPVRAAGLVAAASGHRRLAGVLLTIGIGVAAATAAGAMAGSA